MIDAVDNAAGDLAEIPLSQVVDTMAEGVVVLDSSCRIVLWNRAMEAMTGRPPADVLGEESATVICAGEGETATGDGEMPESACALLKVTEGQPSIVSSRCSLLARGGQRIPVLKNGRVLSQDGRAVAAVVTFTDLRPMHELQAALERTRESLERVRPPGRLVGSSDAMDTVYDRIRLAADSDATVLLLGETGTGKELAADAIHSASSRAERPFVRVSCSALSESLLEAELFGHVRGAFTGAVRDKVGRFEAADGGTILLDEIGDISPPIQLKLLRVLQERQIERVGESRSRPVDVRVICATHRDLRALVAEGTFREDLFYRIRVFPIELPALRMRRGDIPALVSAFIARFNERTGKAIAGVDAAAMRCLMDYCWPGNVRELENAIEHAFVICQEGRIRLGDLPPELQDAETRMSYCRDRRVGDTGGRSAGRRDPVGRDELVELLADCGWNQSEAARRLGVDRTTVWRRMKRMGIEPPPNR